MIEKGGFMRGVKLCCLLLLFFCLSNITVYGIEKQTEKPTIPVTTNLSFEEKRIVKEKIIHELLKKYTENKVFAKAYQFMLLKFRELNKDHPPRSPEVIINESFAKSNIVYEKAKPWVEPNLNRVYQPEVIEVKVNRLLWLKGICFLILGIGEEHKVGIAFFYLPENREIRKELMKEVVKYSYPEVPDIPENQDWFDQTGEMMERLGEKLFNVKQYIPDSVCSKSNNDRAAHRY